jgi:transcriptional regulator with XRE-family HTH domain
MKQSEALRVALMLERQKLAAKLRATRAILNLSQMELASRIGLTQKSIHRLEQAQVEAKRVTIRMLEQFWHTSGIVFDERADGGFTIVVTTAVLCGESEAHPVSPKLDRFPAFPMRVPS